MSIVRARIAVAVLALIAVSLTSPASSVELRSAGLAQVAPGPPEIAFASDRTGNFEIFVMAADGSDPTPLTNDPADDAQPAWSADGTHLAFVRNWSIWVMDAGGSGQTDLNTSDPVEFDYSSSPAWSPDGTQIAYERNSDIWVMNADGSDQHPLITTGTNHDPAWSPDGAQIAFSRAVDGGMDIWLRNLASGEETNLTNDGGAARNTEPAWSPDGTHLAFAKKLLPVDLAITKLDSPDPVLTNRTLTYSLTVTNRSAGQAEGVTVRDTLPEGVTFSTVNTDTGTCSAPTPPAIRVVSCSLGTMPGHSTAHITITIVSPATMGSIINIAQVSQSRPGDVVFANDSASATTTVQPLLTRTIRAELAYGLTSARAPRRLRNTRPPSNPRAIAQPAGGCSPTIFTSDVCLIAVSDLALQDVTSDADGVENADPSFDPDGTMIAFERTICVSIGVERVERTLAAALAPVNPCPFGDVPDGGTHVSLIAADGSNRRDLVGAGPANTNDIDPAWRPSGDLSITKTDSPDPVSIGGDLTYALTITNSGAAEANGVVVSDTLPPGVTLQSATPSQGSCSGTTTVTCSLGTMASGGTATITILVSAPAVAGTITNTANVSAERPADRNLSNNVASETTTVIAADLSLAKSDDPDPVAIGDTMTYELTVTNNSASAATGVLLTDSLPEDVTFMGAEPIGSCAGNATITCSLGTIAEGMSATVSLFVRAPDTSGVIVNTASVSAASPADPDLSNNTDVEDTTVVAADVAIAKTDDPDPVVAGGDLTYTMVVRNNGVLTATDVLVTDPLPERMQLLSMNSTVGRCSGTSVVTCGIGTLESGDSAVVTVVVRVHRAKRFVTNTATVTATSPDDLIENNTASTRTRVGVPTLELLPPVGPPGFVTIAEGSGFPGLTAITLVWEPGIGELEVMSDKDGGFRTQVLILPGDVQGPRLLLARGHGFADVEAPFLVEPATVQPPSFATRS